MKHIAYVRISSDPKDKRAGIARQEKEIRALSARLDLPEPAVLADNDESALTGKRPEFQRLMADLTTGRVTILSAWSQDRLARDIAEWEAVIKLCRKHGVRLVTVTDGEVDLTTTGGRRSMRVRWGLCG